MNFAHNDALKSFDYVIKCLPYVRRSSSALTRYSAFNLLQDLDPVKRPGAGAEGYASLKSHPFFEGVDWKNIRTQTPPKLALEAVVLFATKSALFSMCSCQIHYVAFVYVVSLERERRQLRVLLESFAYRRRCTETKRRECWFCIDFRRIESYCSDCIDRLLRFEMVFVWIRSDYNDDFVLEKN